MGVRTQNDNQVSLGGAERGEVGGVRTQDDAPISR